VYRKNKDFEALTTTLEALTEVSPSEENYYNLASAYLFLPDYEKAIAAYNRSEEKFGVSELIIRQKQRLYLKQGKTTEALAEGNKLIEYFPGEIRYITSQAQLLLANDQTEKAVELLQKVIAQNPDDAEAKLMLAKVYKVQGKDEIADKMIKESFSSNLVDIEQKIEILRMYQQEAVKNKSTDRIKDLASVLVDTHPNSAVAKNLYGDFLLFEEKKKEARKIYLEALKIDGNTFDTWQKVLNIDWELQEYDKIIDHAEEAQEYFPNQPRLYFFAGLGYVMKKDYDTAKDMLESGRIYANTPQLIAQFDAQLGDIYHYLEEYDKSDESYEKVLTHDPNNIQVLNNYAYFLSVRKDKLEKAMEMGKRLIEKAPENATYLDTYGWILYANGKYKEALKYLEKASSLSEDGTIAEHYGDVLYKTGNKEKALEQWKKALGAGGSENEAVLKKKIASGALIE
ncbi:MAG: tetratricopeptide repeat protein, partial [Bacteroidota bacterium]